MKPLPKFLLVIGCALTIFTFTPASSSQTGDFADVDTIYGRSDKQQKSIGSISGELVTDSDAATNTVASGIENDLYFGKKRGLLSAAIFFLKIQDDTALLEQYREFGGVLYKDLTDTLYKKNARLFVGEWTFLELTSKASF